MKRFHSVMVNGVLFAIPLGAVIYLFGRLLSSLQRLVEPLANAVGVQKFLGEFALLMVFLHNSGRVLNRDQLFDLTRGRSSTPLDRSIDIQVSRLRRKIEPGDGPPRLLKTVRGAGYVFTPKVVAT